MLAKSLSTQEFDDRVSAGDSMREYFADYAPCAMSVDELIDEIWFEKEELQSATARSGPGQGHQKVAAEAVTGWLTKVPVSHSRDEQMFMDAVLLTLSPAVRDTSCLWSRTAAEAADSIKARLEEAARSGRLTYVAPQNRNVRKAMTEHQALVMFRRSSVGAG